MLTRSPHPSLNQTRTPRAANSMAEYLGAPASVSASHVRSPVLQLVSHRLSMPVATADLLRSSPAVQLNICGGRPGVSLSLSMQLVDERQSPVAGAWVYIWHDDPSGWSVPAQMDARSAVCFMHGVQVTDATGRVQFVMPYPAARDATSPRIYVRAYWPWGQHLVAYGHGLLRLSQDLTPEHMLPVCTRAEPAEATECKPLPDLGLPVHQLDRLNLDLDKAQIQTHALIQMSTPILPARKPGKCEEKKTRKTRKALKGNPDDETL
ncbi:hypothetical protein [Hydrogenophaga sp. 5NK40-0174]|uniref:hypothetical protein n=1 Tax=Hydrogenophaga sp. 5NK40-0174 TaxID=3127649 RepID=UPI003341A78A